MFIFLLLTFFYFVLLMALVFLILYIVEASRPVYGRKILFDMHFDFMY